MNEVEDTASALARIEQQWPFVLDSLKIDDQLLPEENLSLIVGLRPEQVDEPPQQPLTGDLMALDAIRRYNQNSTPEAQALHTKRMGYRAARRLWDKGHPSDERMRLRDCVAWATRADIEIPWLDAATSAGLINNPVTGVESSPDLNAAHDPNIGIDEPDAAGYQTKLLGELYAAMDKFWKLYDPADPSTAPTNRQVVDYLRGRGVSQRIAEAIATILRADGLPPGPRK